MAFRYGTRVPNWNWPVVKLGFERFSFLLVMGERVSGVPRALGPDVGAFQFDGLHGIASEGEGACLRFVELVTNLPLRGKLGWMTPRAGVKTTLAMRRAFRGPRSQAGALDF